MVDVTYIYLLMIVMFLSSSMESHFGFIRVVENSSFFLKNVTLIVLFVEFCGFISVLCPRGPISHDIHVHLLLCGLYACEF